MGDRPGAPLDPLGPYEFAIESDHSAVEKYHGTDGEQGDSDGKRERAELLTAGDNTGGESDTRTARRVSESRTSRSRRLAAQHDVTENHRPAENRDELREEKRCPSIEASHDHADTDGPSAEGSNAADEQSVVIHTPPLVSTNLTVVAVTGVALSRPIARRTTAAGGTERGRPRGGFSTILSVVSLCATGGQIVHKNFSLTV